MIGKQVGRYRITEEIGRGGMGIVYKATQVTLNRTVAVKMLPQDLASSAEYLARFSREAQTLASLQHPNIVHIYDVEEAEGCHFIIMEYVGGGSLSRRVQLQGRLTPKDTRAVAADLAGALEAAHLKGIIHRDIKPDNILFSEDGTPKLTDFGIARIRDGNLKTQTGIMLGTPYYMSPEQVNGTTVTGASDVYSLGVVMYEMLTGRVPFSADTPVAVALKHLQERAVPPIDLIPSLPGELCAIVERAMAKDPHDRFDRARSLRLALTSLSAGQVEEALHGSLQACACGFVFQPGFVTCPSCGTPLGEAQRQAVDAGEPATGGAGKPAIGVAGKSDARREAVDASRQALAAAGNVVSESAEAALDAVARSAGALWDVLSSTGGSPDGSTTAEPSDDHRRTGGRRLPMRLSDLKSLVTARDVSVPSLPYITWVGIALVLGGIFLATWMVLQGSNPEFTARVPSGPDRPSISDLFPPSPSSGPSGPAVEIVLPVDDGDDAEGISEGEGADGGPRTPTEDAPPANVDAPLDEPAARRAIRTIVERQRLATELNDEALFLRDMHASVRDEARRDLRDLHRTWSNIKSSISNIDVRLIPADTPGDAITADVTYLVELSGKRRGRGKQEAILRDEFTITLEFSEGRWLIVSF